MGHIRYIHAGAMYLARPLPSSAGDLYLTSLTGMSRLFGVPSMCEIIQQCVVRLQSVCVVCLAFVRYWTRAPGYNRCLSFLTCRDSTPPSYGYIQAISCPTVTAQEYGYLYAVTSIESSCYRLPTKARGAALSGFHETRRSDL